MTGGRWRVSVDHTRCMGTGVCAGSRPDRFRLQEHRSWPVQEEVEPDESLLDVADSCPTEAISVRDAAGTLLAPEF
jgi:ferredoxin